MIPNKSIIYQGELDYIARCVMDYPDIETGGDLFGFRTHSGYPVVQYVIGPGPKANHQVTFFNQDVNWLETSGKLLRAAHGLQHIGQWHSHHRLGLAQPSSHDISTVVRAIELYELRQFLLVITNIQNQGVSINGFSIRPESGRAAEISNWVVLEGESPVRTSFDHKFKSAVYRPRKRKALISPLHAAKLEDSNLVKPDYQPEYWLNHKENHRELKRILEGLEQDYPGVQLYMNETDKTVFLEIPDEHDPVRIGFPHGFPETGPVMPVNIQAEETLWDPGEDLAKATIDYIIKTLKT